MKNLTKAAVVVLALTVGTLAWAQTPQESPQQPTPANEPITVTVVSVETDALVVRTETDEELRLTLAADAETPERQLRAGDRIRIWRELDATLGEDVVMRVELADVTLADDPTVDDPMQTDPVAEPLQDEPLQDEPLQDDPVTDDTYGDDTGYGEALPGTASRTPLAALFGVLAVAGAVALRFAARAF